MDTALNQYPEATDAPDPVRMRAEREALRVERVRDQTLDDLARLRRIGMDVAERVGDDSVAFERVARAVRQIVALEQETVGIRPTPRYGDGGGRDGAGQHAGGGDGGGRERLRTGSTRGARHDLDDPPEPVLSKEQEEAFCQRIDRIVAAADLDLAAGGMTREAAKASNLTKITCLIYEVPRPHFEACLDAMARNLDACVTGALVRKWAKPGTHKVYQRPP